MHIARGRGFRLHERESSSGPRPCVSDESALNRTVGQKSRYMHVLCSPVSTAMPWDVGERHQSAVPMIRIGGQGVHSYTCIGTAGGNPGDKSAEGNACHLGHVSCLCVAAHETAASCANGTCPVHVRYAQRRKSRTRDGMRFLSCRMDCFL